MAELDEARVAEIVTKTLRSDEHKAFLEDVLVGAFEKVGQRFGIDTEHPLEMQADMRHLRRWRNALERGAHGVGTAVISAIIIACGSVLLATLNIFHK
jgi:hypothetical protein